MKSANESDGSTFDDSSDSQTSNGGRIYPNLRRMSASTARNDLSFAVVGEGDERQICAFSSHPDARNAIRGIPESGWTCISCTFYNEDSNSPVCSMCKTTRVWTTRRESARAQRGSFTVHGLHEKKRPSLASAPSESSLRFRDLIKEMSSGPSTGKVSETEMNMSFGNWSISDNEAWTCTTCTYVNEDPLHLTCAVCGQGRSKSVDEDAAGQSFQLGFDTIDFNESVAAGQEEIMEKKRQQLLDLEKKAIEKERINELMQMQFKILDEIRQENEKKPAAKMPAKHDSSTPVASNFKKDPHNVAVKDSDLRVRLREVEEWETRLEESRKRLEQLEKMQREEKEDQLVMAEILQHKRREIEQEEAAAMRGGRSGRPQASTRMLQCQAQERMLQDWKVQWEARQQQLEEIRRQQRTLWATYKNKRGL